MKENPTLNIKDLVLLKSNPQKYIEKQLHTIKTHDGTSSGPIRGPLTNFIENNVNSTFRQTIVLDSSGKQVVELKDVVSDFDHEEPLEYEWEDIDEQLEDNDVHIISKISRDDMYSASLMDDDMTNPWFYDKYGNEWTMISSEEASRLLEIDEKGNYKVRSETLVSRDGTSMTYTKNNSFNEENHEAFTNLVNEFNKDMKQHELLLHKETYDAMDKYAMENGYERRSRIPFDEYRAKKEEFRKMAEEQYGDNINYINEKWKNRFEEECNVKLKIQYNSNINPVKIDDDSEYVRTWEEIHEEPFTGDWEDYGGYDEWPSLEEGRRIYDDNMSSPYWGGDGT